MSTEENIKEKAKIADENTGVKVCHTMCEICTRGCGIDAYVKDGKIIKVEGTKGNPTGFGYLCQKGQGTRSYIYREDRIKTPLKRVGKRGEGKFVPITWDEAYKEIAEKLNLYKQESGPDSVVFFSGYTKWYRPIYQRLIYSFGSKNYCTDDSLCYFSTFMANKLNSGITTRPDQRFSGVFLAWAFNRYYSGSIVETKRLEQYKAENGLKIVVVDPRITPASEKLADIHLRPLPGTDGALACCFANLFIEWDRIDHGYISKHVYGFEEYAEYVKEFTVEKTSEITTIPQEDIIAAAHMLTENGPMSIAEGASPLVHHTNGMQTYRAIMTLAAITGNYDRKGGQIPTNYADVSRSGDGVLEDAFALDVFPYSRGKKVGQIKYPLFCEIVEQGQDMDLARHILEKDPYPIRAIFAMGMNYRMLPADEKLLEAIKSLDFFADVDIFLTDTAKYADIVLPACSGFERGTFRNYKNGKVFFSKPAIEPLYESKSDADILCELASALGIDDPYLKAGYKACIDYMLGPTGLTVDKLQESDEQVVLPTFINYEAGTNTATGYNTETAKYEIKSKVIESRYQKYGLEPLPKYVPPLDPADPKDYPLILCSGGRLVNTMHSRLHNSKWHRIQRPQPSADIHPDDAMQRSISNGDDIVLYNPQGELHLKAHVTNTCKKGVVFLVHGYKEADVNSIIPEVYDPYSGYPGLRSARCNVRPEQGKE
ncbi:MAG: molybdopterin-dependent oxidoreductase [Lachnospiraceae bacterium]|nr:molybdopterin-dependent oxidoreductase [Lachnospiraceae bacterium]